MGIDTTETLVKKERENIKAIRHSMESAENSLATIENELKSLGEADMNYEVLKERREKTVRFIQQCKFAIKVHAFRRCIYSVGITVRDGKFELDES